MSKESTKAAFQKAFSTHMLLNLSPEEEASITTYRKSEERIRMEQQLNSTNVKPQLEASDSNDKNPGKGGE